MSLSALFESVKLNESLELKNRIVMAPMTRASASETFVPTSQMADYYARRADAGLIITEGTIISEKARGHDRVPGVFNEEQVRAWRKVTDGVHARGVVIFCQLWHVGRVSHPAYLGGELPVSASATVMSGRVSRSDGLMHGPAREASVDEINALIKQYVHAAQMALEAGFDGIELHGANGYLIDQFLHYDTNKRLDAYGGSPENMARFALELVEACIEVVGNDRVALRVSPGAYLNEVNGDPRDAAVFQYLFKKLETMNIAYVHTGNFNDKQLFCELDGMTMTGFIRKTYSGMLIASGGYEFMEAADAIASNQFDLIAIGRPFIANPDLIEKLKQGEKIIPYDKGMLDDLK